MRRLLTGVVATALLGAAPAAASTIQVGLGLHQGALSLQAPGLSITGAATQVPVRVADARGTGAGWTLRVSGASITSVTARCAAGSTCTLPRFTGGTRVLQAAHDTGMGVLQLVVTVSGSRGAAVAFSVS